MSINSDVRSVHRIVKKHCEHAEQLRNLQYASLLKPFPEDEILTFMGINFIYCCTNLLKAIVNLILAIASLVLALFALGGGMNAIKKAGEIFALQISITLLNVANMALAFAAMFTRPFATAQQVENEIQLIEDMSFENRENETTCEAAQRAIKSIFTSASQDLRTMSPSIVHDDERIMELTFNSF